MKEKDKYVVELQKIGYGAGNYVAGTVEANSDKEALEEAEELFEKHKQDPHKFLVGAGGVQRVSKVIFPRKQKEDYKEGYKINQEKQKELLKDLIQNLLWTGNELRKTNHQRRDLDGDGAVLKTEIQNYCRRVREEFGFDIKLDNKAMKIFRSLKS